MHKKLVIPDAQLDLTVAASSDDAHQQENGASTNIAATQILVQSYTSATYRYWAGLRWLSASLPPKGSKISVCYAQINIVSGAGNMNAAGLHFQKAASPAAFTTAQYDITNRPRTSASVAWIATLAAGWQTTPDLAAVLQEVVDSYSPTALVLIFRPNTDALKVSDFWSYDYGVASILHIEYTPPGRSFGFIMG